MAASRQRAFEWEYAFTVATAPPLAIAEFVRRLVLPSLAFSDADAAASAIPLGVVMALMWSGLARPAAAPRSARADSALAMLSAPFDGRSIRSLLLAGVVPAAAAVASRSVEQIDWAIDLQSADRAHRGRAGLRLLPGPVPRPPG